MPETDAERLRLVAEGFRGLAEEAMARPGVKVCFLPAQVNLLADWLDSAAYDAEMIGPDWRAVAFAKSITAPPAAGP